MYNIGFATQSLILENVDTIFSLLFPLGNYFTILWLFLCRVLCKWMLDHDESFPVFSSVVFIAVPICRSVIYIHDAVVYYVVCI